MTQAATEVGIDRSTLPPAGTYSLDLSHTSVEFVARHILSRTRGRFAEFSGTIEVAEHLEDSALQVEIRAASIQSNDERRDGHLKSADFFDVESHPTLSFRSTGLRITGSDTFELDGELTVKDVTNPLTLSGTFIGWGPAMDGTPSFAASARATIDREDWDLTWNMVLESGGLLVSKKVDIEIEVEATLNV